MLMLLFVCLGLLSRAAAACSHVLASNFAATVFGNRDDDEKAEPLSRAKCKKCVRVSFVQLLSTPVFGAL